MEYLGYLLILLFSVLNLCESIVVKRYAHRHGSGGPILNSITALFALVFFLVTDKGGFFVPDGMIYYAMANAVFYAAGFHLTFVAFKCGPFGLTKLLSTFSLLFPIFYGIFVLKEEGGYMIYLCIAMIFVSVFLINQKKSNAESVTGISLKWFICIFFSVVSNGFISIITRAQQIRFDDACSNEFSVFSLAGAFILMMVLGFITERDKMGRVFKSGTLYGAAAGIFNGAKNFITLAIYLYLPLSVISPIKSGLNIVLTFATALLIYKERYTLRQTVGVALGAAAVIILALK